MTERSKSNAKAGQPYVAQARLYEQLGKIDETEKVYERAMKAGVKDAQVFVAYGTFCEAQKDFDKAERSSMNATAANSMDGSCWLALAQLYKQLGKIDETRKFTSEPSKRESKTHKFFWPMGRFVKPRKISIRLNGFT